MIGLIIQPAQQLVVPARLFVGASVMEALAQDAMLHTSLAAQPLALLQTVSWISKKAPFSFIVD